MRTAYYEEFRIVNENLRTSQKFFIPRVFYLQQPDHNALYPFLLTPQDTRATIPAISCVYREQFSRRVFSRGFL
jgi:hypothetical protein